MVVVVANTVSANTPNDQNLLLHDAGVLKTSKKILTPKMAALTEIYQQTKDLQVLTPKIASTPKQLQYSLNPKMPMMLRPLGNAEEENLLNAYKDGVTTLITMRSLCVVDRM